jgi:RNA polymerase sigma-70 factor (ECF subfamily)
MCMVWKGIAVEDEAGSGDLPGDLPQALDDLIVRCRLGEPAAQRELYDRYAVFVARAARRLGTPPEELEDVAQEVFWVVFRKLGQFRRGDAASWIYRICQREVQHRHRSRRIRRALARIFGAGTAPAEIEGQERVALRHEAERRVGEILAAMSAKKREVFVLFEIEGLSGEAIAERIGCPLDTVWTRLFHARREFTKIARARDFLQRAGPHR